MGTGCLKKKFTTRLATWGNLEKACLNVCHLLVSTGKSRKKQLLNTDHTGFYLQARDRFRLNLRKFRLGQPFPYRKHLLQKLA